MKKISTRRGQTHSGRYLPELFVHGTKLQVPPAARFHKVLRLVDKRFHFVDRVTKGFAVVRKGQRDQSMPCEPTINMAEEYAIFQLGARRRGGKHNRLIAISALQCFEPASLMKGRSLRMLCGQSIPAGIGEWVYPVNAWLRHRLQNKTV